MRKDGPWSMVHGLWTCVAIVVWGLFHALPVAAHSDRAAVAVRTFEPIAVDGELGDWARRVEPTNWAGRLEIKKGEVRAWMRAAPVHVNALTGEVTTGRLEGPRDLSAVIYALWDPKKLYVAAMVDDDEVVARHDGADIWQDDVVEILLDCRHDAVTQTLTQDDEFRLGAAPAANGRAHAVVWVWDNAQAAAVTGQVTAASARTDTGYRLEVAVPWEALAGCAPGTGGLIGFNVAVTDKDGSEPRTTIVWSGDRAADPTQFGHLYFVDAPLDLLPSDAVRAPAERSPLDELTGAAK